MRTALALLATFLMSGPAAAWSFCQESFLPPPEWDHEPTKPYQVTKFPKDWIPSLCGEDWYPAALYGGCVEEVGGEHWITVRDDLLPMEMDCLLRHEKAHVNGWEHPYYPPPAPTFPRGPVRKLNPYEPIDLAAGDL